MTVSEFVNKVGFKVKEEDVKKVNNTVSGIKSTATKILGAIGIGFSLVSIKNLIEEFGQVNNQINFATKGLEDSLATQDKIMESANRCRGSYGEIASAVTGLSQANSEMFPIEDAAKFVEYTTKLGKAAGYNESVISSTNNTLKKVVATGQLGAGEFKNLSENAPAVLSTICDGLGVTKSELESMASAGTVSAQQIKDAMLNSTGAIDDAFDNVDLTISDALKNIRNRWGLWLAQMDKTLGVTKTISKIMISGFNAVMSVLNKLRTGVVWLSEKLGGTEKLLRLIAIVGGSLIVALNIGKIISFLQTGNGLLKLAHTLFGGLSLKVLAIAAAIAIVLLLIDDFYNFMKGNDSLLGYALEQAGIDCDAIRQKVIDVWNGIKDFLAGVWDGIKGAAQITWDAIKDFFSRHSEQIKDSFLHYWNYICDYFNTIWTILSDIFTGIFGDQTKNADGSQKTVSEIIIGTWQKILDVLMPILDAIFDTLNAVFNAILDVAQFILNIVKALWDKWGKDIVAYLKKAFDAIKKIIDGLLSVIKGIANFISGVFTGDWKKAWEGIKQIFSGVWDAIKGIIELVLAEIQLRIKICVDIIKDIWNSIVGFFANLWKGIVNGIKALWNGVIGIFKGIIGWVKDNWKTIIAFILNPFAGVFKYLYDHFEGFRNFVDGVVNSIKTFFANLWEGIKTAFTVCWNAITSFFGNVWENLKNIVSGAMDVVSNIISTVWDTVKNVFSTVWGWITGFFQSIWDGISSAVSTAMSVISNIITTVWDTVTGIFTNVWTGISSFFSGIWEGMQNMVSNVINGISSIVTNIFSSIKNTVANIKDTIVNGFQAAIDWIKGLPSQALSWGSDIISNIAQGIRNAIGKVTDAVTSVADKIKSFLHFSEPDEGPLSNFHTYMPDMIDVMAKGISGGRNKIKDVLGDLTGDMSTLASANMVSGNTVLAASGGGNVSKSIIQNVNINNEFNGDRAIQRDAAKAMDKSAVDVTSQLARGLAFSG